MIAALLRNQGVKRIALVSSVGANAQAVGFYLRTKGELEENVIAMNFEQTAIARPFFLIGRKVEFRLGEETVIALTRLLSPYVFGRLRKYLPIEAHKVARCLMRATDSWVPGIRFIEGDEIQALG
jgi:uncharacterized protein YbjT (DUF2867 family)